ncbi:putative glucan endo-1,3-beta-glucosidase [Lachnellula hyalina]|uniref:Probable glucan endo-1,3-beta-glucosidase eglC n=1 Tax=Lachnellula hyalina TaxID=1316788 RepID=A0A8H8QX70_9HELO|nr:putative glucan endo-1,3-beta-glucosidase [Lachnellula hyalina]TVY23385.1 putative glucan endo-1,3-beta-glucosidase [Lachnellula hyalina]
MHFSGLLAVAASVASASAASQGFNYGSTKSDGTFLYQADYESLFTAAQGLTGTNGGFTSARLYTTIQGGSSTNEPSEAIPAALKTKTSLLLGLWATGTDGEFAAQITALTTALGQWSGWTDLVVGISVGSEDLYRDSATGKAASAGVGEDATVLLARINQLKAAIKGTALEQVPIGHVDTWTAWTNDGSPPTDVISAIDWLGVDAYPYFQNTQSNAITSGKSLFEQAVSNTQAVANGKDIWITETGWPVSGSVENLAIASTDNAKTYWDEVGCPRFGNVNIWWYTLQDAAPTTPVPSFGVVGSTLSTTPLYDLSCSNVTSLSSNDASSSSSSASASATSSGATTLATAVVSSGSPLTPTQGSGVYGSGNSSSVLATGTGGYVASKSSSVATGGSNLTSSSGSSGSGSGSGSASASKTSGPTSAPAGPTATTASAASFMSASLVAAFGAMFVAVLTL